MKIDTLKAMDTLAKLFGSDLKIKLLRLFLNKPDEVFILPEIAKLLSANPAGLKKQIKELLALNFIKPDLKELIIGFKNKKQKKTKIKGFRLNKFFPFYWPLKNLILDTPAVSREIIVRKLKAGGKLSLVILAGSFVQDGKSKLDLLVVGDRLSRAKIEKAVKSIESSIARELNYSVMPTDEFKYRRNMRDRFLYDILESPHEKILDKLEI